MCVDDSMRRRKMNNNDEADFYNKIMCTGMCVTSYHHDVGFSVLFGKQKLKMCMIFS